MAPTHVGRPRTSRQRDCNPETVRVRVSQQFSSVPERWPSGLRRTPAKRVYPKRVPRVQIPPSPPFFVGSIRPTAPGRGTLGGKLESFREGTVHANGLHFATLEAGDGPLVLCLHGFPDHARTFRKQLPVLAAAGFRAVAPFMRGYTPTEIPQNGVFQSAVLGMDAVALIEALGYDDAAIFGHDWGAIAGYGAAIAAPERVARLATAAVPHGPAVANAFLTSYDQQRRSWYMFFFQHPLAEAAVAHDDFRFLERLWQDWSPEWLSSPEEMEALKATFRNPGVLDAALGYYRCTLNPMNQDPSLSELQEKLVAGPITVPTLAFHGVQDGCIGRELMYGMEALFPSGLEKVSVPHAGHFLHLEHPDFVNQHLLRFFTPLLG
jgi:pimeloyl-ACP methyl ester carboxylesterase